MTKLEELKLQAKELVGHCFGEEAILTPCGLLIESNHANVFKLVIVYCPDMKNTIYVHQARIAGSFIHVHGSKVSYTDEPYEVEFMHSPQPKKQAGQMLRAWIWSRTLTSTLSHIGCVGFDPFKALMHEYEYIEKTKPFLLRWMGHT